MEFVINDKTKAKLIIKIFELLTKLNKDVMIGINEEQLILHARDQGATWASKIIFDKSYFSVFMVKDPIVIAVSSEPVSKFLKLHRNENTIKFKLIKEILFVSLISEVDDYIKNIKLRILDVDESELRIMSIDKREFGPYVEIDRNEFTATIKGLAPFGEHMEVSFNGVLKMSAMTENFAEQTFIINRSSPLITEMESNENMDGVYGSKYLINALSVGVSDKVKFGFASLSPQRADLVKESGTKISAPAMIQQFAEGIAVHTAIAPRVRDTD